MKLKAVKSLCQDEFAYWLESDQSNHHDQSLGAIYNDKDPQVTEDFKNMILAAPAMAEALEMLIPLAKAHKHRMKKDQREIAAIMQNQIELAVTALKAAREGAAT